MMEDKSQKSSHEPIVPRRKSTRQRKKWELQQTIKYCEFVKKHRSTLQFTEKKQKQKIYNKMSEYIGTRTTHQCRSHHQKIIKRFDSINGFIQSFTQKINSARTYMEWSQAQLEGLESLRRLEKAKKIGLLQTQRPKISESKLNQFQFLPNLNSKQVPSIQLKRHFSSFNPWKYQYPPDLLPFRGNFGISSGQQSSIFDKLTRNEGIFISQSQNQHKRGQIPNFDVSYRIRQPTNENKNDDKFPHHEMNAFDGLWQSQESSQEFPRHDDEWKMQEAQQKQKRRQKRQIWQYQRFKFMQDIERERFEYKKRMKQRDFIEQFPIYERLRQKPEQRINKAAQICSSIVQKKNLNVIGPLVRENHIELTQDMIRINGKEEENYKYWIECVKVQDSQASEELESESEEIQRELVEELVNSALIKYGIIPSQPLCNQFRQKPYVSQKPQSSFMSQFYPYLNKQYPTKSVAPNRGFKYQQHDYFGLKTREITEKPQFRPKDQIQQVQSQQSSYNWTKQYYERLRIPNENSLYHPDLVNRLQHMKAPINSANIQKTFSAQNSIASSNMLDAISQDIASQEESVNSVQINPEFQFIPLEHKAFQFVHPKPQKDSQPNPQPENQIPIPVDENLEVENPFEDYLKKDRSIFNKHTGEGSDTQRIS